MKEKTEKRINLWAKLLLPLLIVVIPALSTFIDILSKTIIVPLWAFITFALLMMFVFLLVKREHQKDIKVEKNKYEVAISEIEEDKRKWDIAKDKLLEERICIEKELNECQAEIEQRDELVFEDGAYFRLTDNQRQQPLCRVCYEIENMLVTVAETWDGNENVYWCPVCEKGHSVITRYSASKKQHSSNEEPRDASNDEIPF